MIEVKINKRDVARINRLLSDLDPRKQDGAVHKGVLKASATVLNRLVANVSGEILHRRTGNLARSMGFRIERDASGVIESQIGSGASLKTARMSYANIHETGGTIRPVRAKMLAIPIGEALTPAGVARFTPRGIERAGYDGSFVRKSRMGNLILFGKVGSGIGLRVVPLFLLKDKVNIPARKYMSRTVEQTKDQVVQDIIGKIREAKEKG
jgi:phage gpG-like protein